MVEVVLVEVVGQVVVNVLIVVVVLEAMVDVGPVELDWWLSS